ncbi:hypothetical protein G6F68_014853 [Rhizopus microsporus]|nr:hypothetical protein G6F68_014853 [Rhizopus microsporus]
MRSTASQVAPPASVSQLMRHLLTPPSSGTASTPRTPGQADTPACRAAWRAAGKASCNCRAACTPPNTVSSTSRPWRRMAIRRNGGSWRAPPRSAPGPGHWWPRPAAAPAGRSAPPAPSPRAGAGPWRAGRLPCVPPLADQSRQWRARWPGGAHAPRPPL